MGISKQVLPKTNVSSEWDYLIDTPTPRKVLGKLPRGSFLDLENLTIIYYNTLE